MLRLPPLAKMLQFLGETRYIVGCMTAPLGNDAARHEVGRGLVEPGGGNF